MREPAFGRLMPSCGLAFSQAPFCGPFNSKTPPHTVAELSGRWAKAGGDNMISSTASIKANAACKVAVDGRGQNARSEFLKAAQEANQWAASIHQVESAAPFSRLVLQMTASSAKRRIPNPGSAW